MRNPKLANDAMSLPFQTVIKATEEAILNSLLRAKTVSGYRKTVEAPPLAEMVTILRRCGYDLFLAQLQSARVYREP